MTPDSGQARTDAGTKPDLPETVPDFAAAAFSSPLSIDNPFWPLVPGKTLAYFGETDEGPEVTVVQVLDESRKVSNIDTRVVRDRVFLEGLLIEDTHDWYAEDDDGNVWYMGEEVDDYAYDDNGEVLEITHEGAWEAGKDVANTGHVALPGYQMLAMPTVGRKYHQEYYVGQAEDFGEILELAAPVTLADGAVYSTLKTRDSSTLQTTADERKHYAAGIGTVLDSDADGTSRTELVGIFDEGEAPPDFAAARFSDPTTIDNPYLPWSLGAVFTYRSMTEDGLEETLIEVLDETRTVAGIEAVVVRDRVSLEGVLLEDTHDWYAQDDDGNVWYLGEAVDDYIYDDDGELLEVTHPGSWETGVDGAQAGIIMMAEPQAHDSYRQEFYRGKAEDMAYVVSTGVTVTLEDGTVYQNCLQTLDWVPLEAAALEYKFYAPGIGFVASQDLGGTRTELGPPSRLR